MSKILTFGELMLRLEPDGCKRFVQADGFKASFGGAEANVAVSIAMMGKESAFMSVLPDNPIANKAVNELKGFGVDVSRVARDGERIGIYYSEKGYSVRSSVVVYDRAHSSITDIDSGLYDFSTLFDGVSWLHFTGITPALSEKTALFTEKLLIAAKKSGVYVSCDLNFRKKLWSAEKARETMEKLTKYVDLLICNEEDALCVFNVSAGNSNVESGVIDSAGYAESAKQLMGRFGNLKCVAFTLRESFSANKNGWSALISDGKGAFRSRTYDLDIIDRVGGGDAFAAGLIYALSENYDYQSAIEYAAAAGAIKHTVEGDYNLCSKDEISALASGSASGRVRR